MHSSELRRSAGAIGERTANSRRNAAPDRSETAISLIMTESSLMARSNSLLSRKEFPVRTRGEFPRTGLKLLSYSVNLLAPETPNEQNSLYFPS